MKITPVESSTLATVGYDEAGERLQLEFHSRAVYHYFAVPRAVHEALLAATSKGSYFNHVIRGRYRFAQVGSPRENGSPDSVPFGNQQGVSWRAR